MIKCVLRSVVHTHDDANTADDTGNNDKVPRTIHDYLGFLAFVSNEPKSTKYGTGCQNQFLRGYHI